MKSNAIPIVLLKTRSSPNDPYHDYFSANPIPKFLDTEIPLEPIFVPVLKHQHVNQRQLEGLIAGEQISSVLGERTMYCGLIITSQRAVEAVGAVIDRLRGWFSNLRNHIASG